MDSVDRLLMIFEICMVAACMLLLACLMNGWRSEQIDLCGIIKGTRLTFFIFESKSTQTFLSQSKILFYFYQKYILCSIMTFQNDTLMKLIRLKITLIKLQFHFSDVTRKDFVWCQIIVSFDIFYRQNFLSSNDMIKLSRLRNGKAWTGCPVFDRSSPLKL